MAPTVTIPPTPTSGSSPSSDAPRTPVSPNTPATQLPQSTMTNPTSTPTTNAPAPVKRKPSRRANTAERRATHNAVERARRETLNGRFLDLAALLPNLTQIRRPSKSSIVNSSIAYVQASRRHRLLASRELRTLKLEADGLRRELNEWRDRAGIPRVEEPVRSDGFGMVLGGELEPISAVLGEEEEDEDNQAYGGAEEDESAGGLDGVNPTPFAHELPASTTSGPIHLTHVPPRPYENSAIAMYEPAPPYGTQFGCENREWHFAQQQQQQQQQQMQMMQAQRSLFTPPSSAHGLPSGPPSAHGPAPQGSFDDAFFAAFQQHQQQQQQRQQQQPFMHQVLYDCEDGSSITSRRARSASLSASGSSVYGSPLSLSPVGSYELTSSLGQQQHQQQHFGPAASPYGGVRPGWVGGDVELMKALGAGPGDVDAALGYGIVV